MKKRADKMDGCLICGKTPLQARGLCATHHTRFHRQMRRLDESQKKIFEKSLIERGLLLPAKSPGRRVDDDPFRDVASELFVAESQGAFDQSSTTGSKSAKSTGKSSTRQGGSKKKNNKKKKSRSRKKKK